MRRKALKLIVGLGNHSLISTRHSIGMSVLNHLAENLGTRWTYERNCLGFVARYLTETSEVLLLKPKIAMNINGRSILKTVNYYQIPIENILLVQDDLDKPLGKIRMKLEGTAGGHNGVKSAIAALKTDKLKRFKIGIGRPTNKSQVVDYVLNDFNPTELPLVSETVSSCVALLLDELETHDTLCMNENS